jgi:hypothetical protein
MAFATAADLEDYLGVTFTPADEVRAGLLLDAATESIRAYCSQTISQATTTAKLPGTWGPDLTLPEAPVTAVSAVTFNSETLTANSDFFWNSRGTLRRCADFTVAPSGVSHWGGPEATVSVTYTHGHATIPDAIESACLSVAARLFTNPAGVQSEMLGSYQVQYDRSGQTGALNEHEKQMVRQYRRRV